MRSRLGARSRTGLDEAEEIVTEPKPLQNSAEDVCSTCRCMMYNARLVKKQPYVLMMEGLAEDTLF